MISPADVRAVRDSAIRTSRALGLLPVLLVLLVFGCDLAGTQARGVLAVGALDEPAHLATAGLVLLAVVRGAWLVRHRREVVAVLLSSVLIDLDHVPLYLGLHRIALGGRPFSHSLSTVVVLLLVSAVLGRRRHWSLAIACGVGVHFVRDVATGPGLLLFWPLSDREVVVPYLLYASFIVVLGSVSTIRLRRSSRSRAPGPTAAGR